MTDAPKIVAIETKEPTAALDKKPDAVGPAPEATPVAQPAVDKK